MHSSLVNRQLVLHWFARRARCVPAHRKSFVCLILPVFFNTFVRSAIGVFCLTVLYGLDVNLAPKSIRFLKASIVCTWLEVCITSSYKFIQICCASPTSESLIYTYLRLSHQSHDAVSNKMVITFAHKQQTRKYLTGQIACGKVYVFVVNR